MEKSPAKKVKMMDIVRRPRPERAEGKPSIAPIVRKEKEEAVKFHIEKKHPAPEEKVIAPEGIVEEAKADPKEDIAVIQKEISPVYVPEPVHTPEEKAETIREEVKEEQPHAEPHILETHSSYDSIRMTPEVSSIEMDRPIAYIPKEKTSKEEKKVLERIERRERYYEKVEGQPKKKRGIITWIATCLLLGVIAYLVVAVLPRAEISLMPKKVTWEYANTIGANTKIAEVDALTRQIPVAAFVEKKTNTFSFPATGSGKSIERKATGKVTIYNTISSSQQPLLAGTRLETPDGKIFKLKERAVVPGATTEGGKLVVASVEAEVIAEKAGEVYNISPVSKFTIPGFKGTAKYEGFYAESKDSMTGGFIGEGKYPTAADIKTAKESAEKQMKDVIEAFVATQVVPEGFKIIDSSKKYSIIKENVNEGVDAEGNFSIYIEAEGTVEALKEEHVLKLMTALAQQVNGEGYEIRDHTLTYGAISLDAKTEAISLPIEFKGVFWKPINVEEFKKNVIGKKEEDLKAYVFSSTAIEKADVALWPFWVKAVPNDPERVKVELK